MRAGRELFHQMRAVFIRIERGMNRKNPSWREVSDAENGGRDLCARAIADACERAVKEAREREGW